MSWNEHIAAWASRNDRVASEVAEIAENKGWEPAKYQDSMRADLFDYLSAWYTLAVKTLPKITTKNTSESRKNPCGKRQGHKYTKLSNGWRIWTLQDGDIYTIIASDDDSYIEYTNNTLNDSL